MDKTNEQQDLLNRIEQLREEFKNADDEIMKKIIISRGRALKVAYEMLCAKENKNGEITDVEINDLFGRKGEALT